MAEFKEVTEVFLKNGEVKKIEVINADEKMYSSDNFVFVLRKENEYCYLIPSDNIYLVSSYKV